ncbi:hypothetical protein SQW19_05535 [Stenotrophomonas acidaminiphila]|uniref:hypothetical protein n=1 Tax=Stenotrophomonas acidaminiphila TaxID=128780 RepID=UPI002ABD58A2|nr:hypothetical protein [Stenotrophomonas acidaminiphila]WPU57052.1 hypothetical protein SQW19_05535 [Stenotrophomonas acidaminiphila]
MSHRTQILEKIEQAMKSACEQTELFTDAKSEPIAAEYLFTVEVAKAIAELNAPPGDPYIIRVERDADTFAKDCLRPSARGEGDGFRRKMILRKSRPDVGRSGRVDVTVYADELNSGYWGYQPVCAIEVKGFDPAKRLVLEDLRRNLCFLRVTGDTGESVLEFTVFAAFHSYKRTTDRWVAVHENEIRQRYKGWINDLGDLSDIKVDVQAIRVSLDQQGTITCGIDYDEIDISTKHHIVGAIVVMSRALVSPSQGLGGDSI